MDSEHAALPFGKWSTANIEQSGAWPSGIQIIGYGDREIVLTPPSGDTYPAASIILRDGEQYIKGWHLLAEFLSALCWVENVDLGVWQFSGGSGRPNPMGGFRRNSQHFTSYYKGGFRTRSISKLGDEPKLAAANWREGRSLWHSAPAYSFLAFYRIVERVIGGKRREAYFNDSRAYIDKFHAPSGMTGREALARIEQSEADFQSYLRDRCRCAIVHATQGEKPGEKTISPDDIGERDRIAGALPVMAAIASRVMIEMLGLPKPV